MLSFLFWNLNKSARAAAYLGRIALTYRVDAFLLAECPADELEIVRRLSATHRGEYQSMAGIPAKVRVFSRLHQSDWTPRFTNLAGDMTVWRLRGEQLPFILLAVLHLPAKSGGVKEADQLGLAGAVAADIAEVEDREGSQDTLLVGDLNMNPFDPGVVSVTGLHGLMTTALAARPERQHRRQAYRRFYNPMWGLFGDRTPGPAGTHYWESSVPSNQHWQMLDQVLLRPSLMGRLRNLQVLAGDGYQSLLAGGGAPSKDHLSDHLPILFHLDV